MRLGTYVVALSLLVASGSVVHLAAQEKKAEPPAADEKTKELPLNPFEKAVEGEWTTLFARVKVEAVEQENPLAEMLPQEMLLTWRVTKVADDDVTVTIETLPGKNEDKTMPASKKKAPTLEAFLQMNEFEHVSSVKVADEKKTVNGKEFSCKKVSFITKSSMQNVTQETVLWLSPDVKGAGLVAVTMRTLESGVKMSVTMELAGFGSAKDKVDWGKKPEEIAPTLKVPAHPKEPNEDDGEMAPPKK